MAKNFYGATIRTGGGIGALDSIDGANLNNLDAAFVQTLNTLYPYTLDEDSGLAEDGINVIIPDTNPGIKRWILQNIHVNSAIFEGNVGIGTASPSSILHIKANTPGTIGSHPAGQLIIQDPDDTVFGNAVITGYESDGAGNPDQQLWYLGSSSASNSAITFLNRRNANLSLGTNGVTQIIITGDGNVGLGTPTPTSGLQMGDDRLIAFDTNSAITASTTQSQGNGSLTAQINEIDNVAFTDDTVTLPPAVVGISCVVINNGANTLQIFPDTDDNLGRGLNLSEQLEANETVEYVAYDATNWKKEASTEIIHAEMHDEDNTDAFVINDAGADFHSYHTNGIAAGDLADWTFDIGGGGTSFPIASIADGAASGVDIAVTTTGDHLLAVGDIISQTNLAVAAYVGIFIVKAIISTTVYEVAAVFDVTATGTMDQASTLIAGVGSSGVYYLSYWISAILPVGNNETFDFQLDKNATLIVGTKVRRKFGTAGDFGSMSGGGVVSVADGDKISLALSNEDSAADITIRNFTLVLIRL